MDSRDYKGLSIVTGETGRDELVPYWLTEIIYHPTRSFYATVGFAMFEAVEEDRDVAVRFAPELEFVDSLSLALSGKSVQPLLLRARPLIERLVVSAKGIEPLLFPNEFGIPSELRFLPPIRFETDNFIQEADRK